ncbi:MAG: V-type ATP synthase subunit F [Candidatus Nezhaarchaeales archaeon]
MKIIAIGSQDFVAGLRLAGVNEGFVVSNFQDTDEKLSALIKRGDVTLILVEESYALEIPKFYDKYLKLKQPIIAVIPTGKAKEGARDYMSELIKRTIGVEVVIK